MNKVYIPVPPTPKRNIDVINKDKLNNDVPFDTEFNCSNNTRLLHLRPDKPNKMRASKTALQNQFIRLLRDNNLWYSITYNKVSVGPPFRKCSLYFRAAGEIHISIVDPLYFQSMMSTATIFCNSLPCILHRMVQIGLLSQESQAKIKMVAFPTREKQEFATLIKVRKEGEKKVFPQKSKAFR